VTDNPGVSSVVRRGLRLVAWMAMVTVFAVVGALALSPALQVHRWQGEGIPVVRATPSVTAVPLPAGTASSAS
jgi:hypothetical protein